MAEAAPAPTTAEAMQLVRDEMGDDAIIVSTHRDTDGEAVRVIASMDSDMTALKGLIRAAGADPLLVLPAGGDALEAADMAQAFADAGAGRMVVTRLDVTRRLGGMLAAAETSRLGFPGVSTTPRVSKGLSPISAVSLARLIMLDAMRKPETEDGQAPTRMAGTAS